MKKGLCLGLAALMAAGISIAPGLAGAQDTVKPPDKPLTQQGVRTKAQHATQAAQQKWASLTPAQQQQILAEAQVGAQTAAKQWNAMTPQQKQQALQHAQAGGQKLAAWWKQLPPQ